MGLFQWLFGKQDKESESSPKPLPEKSHEITPTKTLPETFPGNSVELEGSGSFSFLVVGESYYQDNLKKICGDSSIDGIKKVLNATLIHADDNQYDNEAVRIEISGKIVGHMSRTDAKLYRAYMRSRDWTGLTAICKAKISGGWDRGQGDVGSYGVSLDLPSDFNELYHSVACDNRNDEEPSEPNTIMFNVERPHIRDFNEVGANVNLWIPKEAPVDVYIFHRDGPDGKIGTIPLKYSHKIMSHILAGLEYEAKIIELGNNLCKIKCKLLSREETEIKKAKKAESLRNELTKPYKPKKPIEMTFFLYKKRSAKVGDKLIMEFDELDSYVNDLSHGNIRFLNKTGDVVGTFDGYVNIMQRLLKAHFNSYLFDIEILDIAKERNRYGGGYLTKIVVTPYKNVNTTPL